MRALALLALVACSDAVSTRCDDGTYCPSRTVCGAGGACLVANGECENFVDLAPCLHDGLEQGHCKAGTCIDGVEVLGFTASQPGNIAIPGIPVHALDRPEVLPVETNANGFFALIAPPNSDVIVEISNGDYIPVLTRVVHVGESGSVPVDFIYGGIPLITRELAEIIADMAGTAIEPGLAAISGTVNNAANGEPLADATVRLSDPTCIGPIYTDRQGQVDPQANTTTDSGTFIFFNCAVGASVVEVDLASTTCHTLDVEAEQIPLQTFADKMVFVGRVLCE